MKFVFISGSHKSGTSWLGKMIGAHPKIGIAQQELWLMGHHSSLVDQSESIIDDWLNLPTVSMLYNDEDSRRRVRASILRAMMRGAIAPSVGSLEGLNMIGDKTPNFYAENAETLYDIFPDCFFIHIIRDPRDVIVSHHFHAYRLNEWKFFGDPERAKYVGERIKAGENVGLDLLDIKAVEKLCSAWNRVQIGALAAEQFFNRKFCMVTYEDLLESTTENLLRIFNVLEHAVSEAEAKQIVSNFEFSKLAGGRAAGVSDHSNFFRKGIAGDWKNHFSDKTVEIVQETCGQLAAKFSYEL